MIAKLKGNRYHVPPFLQQSTPGAAAMTTVTISGTEALMTGGGTAKPATGTISLTYSGGAMVKEAIPLYLGNSITLPDGYHVGFIATANSAIKVANALAAVLNQTASPVTAVVTSGGTASAASVVLTTKTTGADQNGAITLSLLTTKVKSAPASLSGGGGNAYDTGTVTANIDGTAVAVGYSQSSTAQTLASSLAAAISSAGAGVTATAAAGAVITVTDSQSGTAGNGLMVTLSSATNQPKIFPAASFSGTSGTLSGGTTGTSTPATVYSYSIPNTSGYETNGNLLSYTDQTTDPVNDQFTDAWTMSYDNLNRVTAGSATSGVWKSLVLSWSYDSFGNRKTQTPSGMPTAPVPQPQSFTYPSKNQISNYGAGGYDAAGNVIYDQVNHYLYDAEGRVCAVSYYNGTMTAYIEYVYDAEGRRVAKGSTTSFNCNPASNGFALTDQYILGLSGEAVSELDGAGNFLRSNAYANGELLATYTNNSTYFALNDWLGSKRVVTNPDGTVAEMCMNLPFGDDLICSGSDPSAHHFTGQLHDQESGNDYFDARYYANSTGRFISPDPSGIAYASAANPQSLNLYSYALNNPLRFTDPTGLYCFYGGAGDTPEMIPIPRITILVPHLRVIARLADDTSITRRRPLR